MFETSALIAGFSADPSRHDMERRPHVLRLMAEAQSAGSTIQIATASFLEVAWKGPVPGSIDGLEPLAFDAQAMRALAKLQSLPAIAQGAGSRRLVKFDAMVLASAIWRSDVVVAYDNLFPTLIAALAAAQARDPRYLPEKLPRVCEPLSLLPPQEPLVGEGFPTRT